MTDAWTVVGWLIAGALIVGAIVAVAAAIPFIRSFRRTVADIERTRQEIDRRGLEIDRDFEALRAHEIRPRFRLPR